MSDNHIEKADNLLHISPVNQDALDAVFEVVTDKLDDELMEYWSEFESADIFSDLFQIMRIRVIGWQVNISKDQREKYGISAESIDNMGSTSDEDEGSGEGYYHYFNSIGFIKQFVGGAFLEQAKIDGIPLSDIDVKDEIIDAHPVKKKRLGKARATREGMFMMDADELETQWKQENGLFYKEVMALKDDLVEDLTHRSATLFKERLPDKLVDELEPQIRDRWENQLLDTALNTYAMFTPNTPKLIPVPVNLDEI